MPFRHFVGTEEGTDEDFKFSLTPTPTVTLALQLPPECFPIIHLPADQGRVTDCCGGSWSWVTAAAAATAGELSDEKKDDLLKITTQTLHTGSTPCSLGSNQSGDHGIHWNLTWKRFGFFRKESFCSGWYYFLCPIPILLHRGCVDIIPIPPSLLQSWVFQLRYGIGLLFSRSMGESGWTIPNLWWLGGATIDMQDLQLHDRLIDIYWKYTETHDFVKTIFFFLWRTITRTLVWNNYDSFASKSLWY